MKNTERKKSGIGHIVSDLAIITAAYPASALFWLGAITHKENMAVSGIAGTLAIGLLFALLFVLAASLLGLYDSNISDRFRTQVRSILAGNVITLGLTTGILYLFRLQEFSRGVIGCFFMVSTAALILKYQILSRRRYRRHREGRDLARVLAVGSGPLAVQYAEDLKEDPRSEKTVIGFIGPEGDLGDFDSLDSYLHEHIELDNVVIALEESESAGMRDVIRTCEKNGVHYSIIPYYNDLLPAQPAMEVVGRSRLVCLRRNRLENVGSAFLKRTFDVVCSGLGLIVLSPVLAVLALGVRLSSPGPILFRQERVGYGKRNFSMLKFRSMRVNNESNTAWSTNNDSRKTKFGSFIRKYSLDELPQLWNVFVGDMSLVGPRPELPYFVEQFRDSIPMYMVKHQVRPGITGWAQVNGYRGDTSIEKRIEYDLWYIENWSFLLDIRILFKTVFGGMMNSENIVK